MELPHGFSQSQVSEAADCCIERLDQKKLCYVGDFDIIVATKEVILSGAAKPETEEDKKLVGQIFRIIPEYISDK